MAMVILSASVERFSISRIQDFFVYKLLSIQCAVYTIRCVEYTTQCAVYTIECEIYTIQCEVYTIKCAVYKMCHILHSSQCMK